MRNVKEGDLLAIQELIRHSFLAMFEIYPNIDPQFLSTKIDEVMTTDLEKSIFEVKYFRDEDPKHSLWVAEDQNGIVMGCIGLIEKSGDVNAELVRMAVSPASQGLGIGTLLSKAVDEYCEQRNIASVYLYTANTRSVKFYEKCGYVQVEGGIDRVIEGVTGNVTFNIFKLSKDKFN